MGAACCRCVQPASVQPRKTYNTLVGQLFSAVPIKTDEPIDSTMRRKIQKLQEYLQANPAKVPKASRRLMRRIKATLRKPGDNLGHVKVAVHTYAYLLAMSADESSSYSPNFFLKELLTGPDAVVPLLLRDIHIEMRTLGAELLAVFTGVQSAVDSKLEPIQAHVPQVCRVAQAALRSDRKEQKLQETAERWRAGDKLAVPDPIYLIARRDPAHVAALEMACLRCLTQVVVLCRENKVVPAQIHEIQAVMLDNLQASRAGTGAFASYDGASPSSQQLPAATDATAVPPGVVDTAFYTAMGMQQYVPQGYHPREQAEQLLRQMAGFTQDIAMVDRILDSFYEYMDDRGRWQEAGVVKYFLAALGAGAGQQCSYPIFASLLRHACSRKLSASDCRAILHMVKDQGVQLNEAYSLSALQLALEELPKAWGEQARQDPRAMLMKPFLDWLRAGTTAMKDLAHIGDASPVPGQQPSAAQPGTPARPEGSDRATPAATPEPAAAVPQQLAGLRLAMVQTVQALAGRVQTGGELCEVVTGVLQAVTEDLNYPGISSPASGNSATGGTAAANGLGEAGAGASPFLQAAALPAGASLSSLATGHEQAEPISAIEPAKLATAGMALQLAAAATEAGVEQLQEEQQPFTTPLNSFTGAAASSADASFTGGPPVRQLADGVLPGKLVMAAAPLLRQGPAVLRHAVQRILLALLPAAPQGVETPLHAGHLAESGLHELRHAAAPPAAAAAPDEAAALEDSFTHLLTAGADALLRCCLHGQQHPPAGAVLAVARALLQQQGRWAQLGYRSSGGGSAVRAHAVLLLFNSQLAAVADATGSRQLLTHQLPLEPQGHPCLSLTTVGLLVAGQGPVGAAAAAASAAAMAALEQQHPTSPQQTEALQATLLQVPLLVESYAEQLPALLDPQRALRLSATGGDAGQRDRAVLSTRVSAQLPERKSTFSKGRMLHVGDLLQRNSMTRAQALPPLADVLDSTASPAQTGGPVSGVAGSRAAPMARSSPAAMVAAADAGSSGRNTPSKAGPQPAAVSGGEVELQVPGVAAQPNSQGASAKLSDTVAAVLKQPGPAAAYVVRDIKISRLAGQLDPQL